MCCARMRRTPATSRTDMFQELLIADLVVADLTLANPNVWYELECTPCTACAGV